MKKLLCVMVLFLGSIAVAEASDGVDISGYQVYEFDAARFAPNDSKPTLYDIKLVAKASALWVEGADYNYQWLTIVPYDSVKEATLERVRGNPFVTDTESWLGRQLAKAGDLRGWFTIAYADKKGIDRQIILLAPVNQDGLLAEVLAEKKVRVAAKGERQRDPAPQVAQEQVLRQQPVPESASMAAPPKQESVDPAGLVFSTDPVRTTDPVTMNAVRLIDLMTVSEFRAAGLMKLTETELAAFDTWMNQYLMSKTK